MGGESAEDARERGRQRPTVTLLVDPKEAEHLAFAETLGDITLTLRADDDLDYADTDGAGLDALVRHFQPTERRERVRPVPETFDQLKWIRGPDVDFLQVDKDGMVR